MTDDDDDDARRKLLRPIGERLREAREQAGMSRVELARVLGLAEGNPMYKYETGLRPLSVLHVIAAAEALNVSCDWLLTGREPTAGSGLKGPAKKDPRAEDFTAPMLELINLGWISLPIDEADLRAMRTHLANGYPAEPRLLALAVRSDRLMRDGSDENQRALLEAAQRHTAAFSLTRLDEPEEAAAPAPASVVVASTRAARVTARGAVTRARRHARKRKPAN